jgi:hypothetical protein
MRVEDASTIINCGWLKPIPRFWIIGSTYGRGFEIHNRQPDRRNVLAAASLPFDNFI